ncbi:MAG: phosphate acyltransferase PlsX [Candidatus Binatus sp.]|uniref:phosphate acyltransferase PlsX n=1 Tax=Candidatus Binatus sp. TaxID=2811406 RepID=UPI002724ADA3|nr:phosphate acyltransferase PlsX [Candidatus Binatus sp.]MDO8430941.1 phosphate acyltransferase PlsX [Candidatus Binatus sp.]
MKIALDAMGGDLAPKATVEGAVLAARDFGIEVVLVGDREILAKDLAEHDASRLPIRIEHAPEVILMDDAPLDAVLSKQHSSIHVGLELVKRGEADAFVSAGNSGAVMTASMMILGNLNFVDRPAIASLVPTREGEALLIDAGANTEVKPINLLQFAVMGSVYWRHVRNVSRPRVGILSNGEEASKGTELTRAAAAMLEQVPTYVNYIGYVEGRDINGAKADIIVTDGFNGNVALKTMEGFASFMLGNLRELFGTNWRTRLAYLLVRKNLTAMRERLDPNEYGGAPLLGISGVSIIAHGSSNPRAIRSALRAASNEHLVNHVNAEILEILGKIQPAAGTAKPPAGKGIRALFSKMRERLHRKDREEGARKDESHTGGEVPHEAPLEREEIHAEADASGIDAGRKESTKTGSLKAESHADGAAVITPIDASAPAVTNGATAGVEKNHTPADAHPAESGADRGVEHPNPKDHQ